MVPGGRRGARYRLAHRTHKLQDTETEAVTALKWPEHTPLSRGERVFFYFYAAPIASAIRIAFLLDATS